MALGCLPVVYNIGGVKEFVAPEFRYENLSEAADKVKEAINNWSPSEARKMRASVERFAEPNFRKEFTKIFVEYCAHIR
jgi:glycosyltransferase involved in cell wall biosynthesis